MLSAKRQAIQPAALMQVLSEMSFLELSLFSFFLHNRSPAFETNTFKGKWTVLHHCNLLADQKMSLTRSPCKHPARIDTV